MERETLKDIMLGVVLLSLAFTCFVLASFTGAIEDFKKYGGKTVTCFDDDIIVFSVGVTDDFNKFWNMWYGSIVRDHNIFEIKLDNVLYACATNYIVG